MNRIRVFVVDDHYAFRQGIKTIIDSSKTLTFVGEAANGLDFIEQLNHITCDVVLMDIRMPDMDGFEATQITLELKPSIKIIALTLHEEVEYIKKMLDCGVMGYVAKVAGRDELLNAIEQVYAGNTYYSGAIARIIAESFVDINKQDKLKQLNIHLTKNEIKVLMLICKGQTNIEIADELHLSPRTTQGHRMRLLRKTDSKNTAMLVMFAIRHGLVMVE